MRAVVTVVGKDKTGIIAKVSAFLSEKSVNILDISQTILQEYLSESSVQLSKLADECNDLGKKIGMSIHVQHEEIFNAMHKI